MKMKQCFFTLLALSFILSTSIAYSADTNVLRKSTPEAVAKGKALFSVQCALCHGPEGFGDGPAGAAFNPKPRNFHAEPFKNGGAPSQIFTTLKTGLGSMPSFAALPEEDRWALVHFVRTFNPKNPDDTAETLKLIGLTPDGKSIGGGEQKVEELPVEFIMKRMADETKSS